MKSQNSAIRSAGAFLLACCLLSGCETKSTDELEVRITPNRATIRKGQTIALKASGWMRYQWSIENPNWGALSAMTGETTYYTATVATNGVQVITVIGSGTPTEGIVSTNQAQTGVLTLTGEARITHDDPVVVPDEDEDEDDAEPALTVSPTTAQVSSVGATVTFTASGGTGTYAWSITDDSLGTLSATTGGSTTYTVILAATGNQTLWLNSGETWVSATIVHSESAPLPPGG